jgi:branched-subunit amino acid aminotransferase/4-amino-4-deoxychorismate lyase
VALAVVRWPGPPPLAGHKSLARLAWDLARAEAAGCGADDALLVDGHGLVLETSAANLWIRHGHRMLTPPAPELCLPGILRGWLLEHLQAVGLEPVVAELDLDQALEADEVWISNAVVGIRRVCGITSPPTTAGTTTTRTSSRRWRAWPAHGRVVRLCLPAPAWP